MQSMHFLHAYKLHVSGTKSDSEASPPGGAEGETKSPTPMSGNDTKVGATSSASSADSRRPLRKRMFCSTPQMCLVLFGMNIMTSMK